MTEPSGRRGELAASLADLDRRLGAACASAGRRRGEVTLVAVTKTFPASDIRLLAGLGVRDVGENRDNDAAAKHSACADLDLRWHFVGQLQRNKCRSVARYADVVHSVDRGELVDALDAAAGSAGRTITALIQVSLNEARPGGTGRGGASPAAVRELAARVAGASALTLGGVMAVAPLGADPDRAFGTLADIAAALRVDHPGATAISAGMSGDLEAAIRHGATHVRVGTALLGRRGPLVG